MRNGKGLVFFSSPYNPLTYLQQSYNVYVTLHYLNVGVSDQSLIFDIAISIYFYLAQSRTNL